jgi:hypothetical protein
MSAPAGTATFGLLATRAFVFGTPAACLGFLLYDAWVLDNKKEEAYQASMFEKIKIERAMKREFDRSEANKGKA